MNNLSRNEADRYMQTGRMLYLDDEIGELKTLIERKIREKLRSFMNKIVIFDIDGTLCRFRYTEDGLKLLPCRDDDLAEYLKDYNMYDNAAPLETMKLIVKHLDPDKVYTLSKSTEPAAVQKRAWLKVNYPTIREDHVFFTSSVEEKFNILNKIKEDNPTSQIVFVEDTADTLLKVEERIPGIATQHISEFLI